MVSLTHCIDENILGPGTLMLNIFKRDALENSRNARTKEREDNVGLEKRKAIDIPRSSLGARPCGVHNAETQEDAVEFEAG